LAVNTTAVATPSSYPVRLDVEYPERLSRLLIFVKWLLAIPHLIILYLLNIAYSLITFVAFFTILFTRKYPEDLFKFAVGCRRWSLNVNAYLWLMRDEYPPFSIEPGQYAAALEIEHPAELNRWLPLVKWLLAIPHLIVLTFLYIAAAIAVILAWFAILFTARYPDSLFKFVVGVLRWSERVTAYMYLMRDEYPPFSLD